MLGWFEWVGAKAMRVETIAGACLAAALLMATSGCASDEEKICKKMFTLVEKATGEATSAEDQAKCKAELAEELANCENRDKAVDCYLALEDIKGVTACGNLCKGAGKEEPKTSEEKPGDDS